MKDSTSKMSLLEKIKSKPSDRNAIIYLEDLKEGKLHNDVKLPLMVSMIAATVIAIVTIVMFSISQIQDVNTWVAIILSMQLVVIFLQLYFIRVQTKYFKITHEPELIINVKPYAGTPWTNVNIMNYGSTAHRVSFYISPKKGERLELGEENTILHTLRNNEEKVACQVERKDFYNKMITVRLFYYNKVGNTRVAVYKKLPNEEDFIPIRTGL